MRFVPLFIVVALSLTGSACRFGGAQFSSTLVERSFDPSGTVFSYIDATDDDLVKADPHPRVAVAMTWIVFDPNSDLNDLDGSALADASHELKLRDALTLVFDQEGEVKTGAAFESVIQGEEETGDGKLTTVLHLSPERITSSSRYADIKPLASKRTTDITITSVDFTAAAPVIAADINIAFARTGADNDAAREGTITGSFQAPIVGERAAESNLALLDVADVMGLPLAPRPASAASAP